MIELARRSLCALSILTLALVLALPIGCAPTDPVAKIAAARQDYTAQLSSWIVRRPEPPPEVETVLEDVEGDPAAAAGDEEADDGQPAMVEPAPLDPRDQVVLFDIIVLYSGADPLPGLTVDISHVGPDGSEKAVRRHFLELPNIRRGSTEQVGLELDGWDLADGDSFAIDIREVVPEAERGDYREFQNAG